MLVRRRKVRIEVEQQTVRMEVTSNVPAVPAAGTGIDSVVEPTAPSLAQVHVPKKLKSGEAL